MKPGRHVVAAFGAVVVLLFVVASFVTKEKPIEVTELSFKQGYNVSDLKWLEGKKVTINGFMSSASSLDGAYIYLTDTPYSSKPFVKDNTKVLTDTLAVYAGTDDLITFTDRPVRVVGTLVFDNMQQDENGYGYEYRLINAEAFIITNVEGKVKDYDDLAKAGVLKEFVGLVNQIYATVNYEAMGLKSSDLLVIDLKDLDAILAKIDKAKYSEFYSVVSGFNKVITDMNKLVEGKKYDELTGLNTEINDLWASLYAWLDKITIE